MRIRTSAVAVLGAAVALTSVGSAGAAELRPGRAADPEIVDVRGTGGKASLVFETALDGLTEDDFACSVVIETKLDVQASLGAVHERPGAPSSSSALGVEVEQTEVRTVLPEDADECHTGYELLNGRFVPTDFDFTTSPDLTTGTLGAVLLTGERNAELSVTWDGGTAETVAQNLRRRAEGARVVNEKHAGVVAQSSASAVLDVDAESFDSEVMVAESSPLVSASLWETESRRITIVETRQPAARSLATSSTATASTFATTTTCTGGYWSGFWTWTGSAWRWTWVWYQCSGGWVVS